MSTRVLLDGKIDIIKLKRLASKPKAYERGDSVFWTDPYISQQMLQAHLDPTTDAASRKPETIDKTVNWLSDHLGLAPGMRVLDLGCGPGLYCSRLAQKGLSVTGMDFSLGSVEYAKRQAKELGLDIKYINQDYLSMDYTEEFDAILIIYCDFGVLTPDDRDSLLAKVRKALKPGGYLVFDVWADSYFDGKDVQEWQVAEKGFWSATPYIRLYQRFHYPDAHAILDQYVILKDNFEAKVYRTWELAYSPARVASVVSSKGFKVKGIWGDLSGNPYRYDSTMMGVICQAIL